MKILSRMKGSLFSPSEIASFQNDKKRFTTLYFFILVLFLIVPSAIIVGLSYDIDYSTRVEVRKAFLLSEVIPYEIKDNTLVKTKDEIKDYYKVAYGQLNIFFSSNEDFLVPSEYYNSTNLLFGKDGIYIATPLTNMRMMAYSDYSEFEGLDFQKANTFDQDFWNQAFDLLSKVNYSFKPVLLTMSYVVLFIQSVIILVVGSLILTVFGRFGDYNYFAFSKHWQLMIYVMTPFVFGNVLSTLLGIRLLYYIGLFTTLIYSFGVNQSPSMKERL